MDLTKTYGTPLHIVDEQRLRSNYHEFLRTFEQFYPKVRVLYSYKTNCIPAVIKTLHQEGCGAEVVSPYELWLATRLKGKITNITYNGVNKSTDQLKTAVEGGVNLINTDSVDEIYRLQSVAENLKKPVNFGIRIYPEVGWRAQFGIEPEFSSLAALIKKLNQRDLLRLRGLHVHIGTGIQTSKYYRSVTDVICSLIHKLKKIDVDVEYFDIGGGFGVRSVKRFTLCEAALYRIFNIPPRAPNGQKHCALEMFAKTIGDSLKAGCSRYRLKEPYLVLEPGRALTSNSQILLLSVGDIKQRSSGKTYAIMDGGMQNLAFPLSYEYHLCVLANNVTARASRRYFVTGPLCSPEDVLYRNWRLPELRAGDVLAIMDAGAYFTSFANNFSYPRPPIVMVSEGNHRLVRERERFDHMVALDYP